MSSVFPRPSLAAAEPDLCNKAAWKWNHGAAPTSCNDDVEIDPNNRDHVMHLDGPGIWETMNASSATPSWTVKVNNIEETATLAVITPPAGATYKFINSAGDIGTWVQTDLATMPTKGPTTNWSNGNSADMSWSDPQYIAAVGAANWSGGAGYGYWSGDGGHVGELRHPACRRCGRWARSV